MHPVTTQQYRGLVALFVFILCAVLWQNWTLKTRLDRLEKTVESADASALDVLEMQKAAAGRPSLGYAP